MVTQCSSRVALVGLACVVLAVPLCVEAASATTPQAMKQEQLVALVASDASRSLKGFAIATITVRGTNPRIVAPASRGPRVGDFVFSWSPNGRSIAYPCSKGINDQRFGVCAVDVATGHGYRVTHSPSLRIEPFAWGPRGQILSDCNDRAVCFVDARTGRVSFITKSGSSPLAGYTFGDDVVWSPDGHTVAFSCRKKTQQDRRFCFVANGKLTVQPRSWNGLRIEGWTPDSKRIVWWGRFSGSDVLGYHEQNVDGSGLRPLPADAVVRGPLYSADGRHRLTTRGGRLGLAEEPVSGGGARTILPAGSGVQAWSYAFQP